MISLKLLRIVKDEESHELLAVVHLNYEGHKMGGDGEIIILELDSKLQIGGIGVVL